MRLVNARLAGLLYLLILVFGLFSQIAVRSRLTTAEEIAASEGLYRVGFAANLVYLLVETVLVIILYRLFEPVDRDVSLLAATFRLACVVVQAFNLLTMLAALLAARDGGAGVPLVLDLFEYGFAIALAFFAVCCATTAYLLLHAERVPRVLAYLWGVTALGYLVNSFWLFSVPDSSGTVTAALLAPAVVAETWFAVLLLRRGGGPFAAAGTLSVHERGTAVRA